MAYAKVLGSEAKYRLTVMKRQHDHDMTSNTSYDEKVLIDTTDVLKFRTCSALGWFTRSAVWPQVVLQGCGISESTADADPLEDHEAIAESEFGRSGETQ